MTYTYALLEVSAAAYDEIAALLRAADYNHAFGDEGEIDMHGIALTRAQPSQETTMEDPGQPMERPKPQALPAYISHKRVEALKIARILPHDPATGSFLLAWEDERYSKHEVSREWLLARSNSDDSESAVNKMVGGWWVKYGDGYESWSPAEAFEAGYRPDVEGTSSL